MTLEGMEDPEGMRDFCTRACAARGKRKPATRPIRSPWWLWRSQKNCGRFVRGGEAAHDYRELRRFALAACPPIRTFRGAEESVRG